MIRGSLALGPKKFRQKINIYILIIHNILPHLARLCSPKNDHSLFAQIFKIYLPSSSKNVIELFFHILYCYKYFGLLKKNV
jgi:hypothetical protein